jgi:hypothetical protein
MNPFVNPKKRGILLPSGCKDLADVLRLPTPKSGDPIRAFLRMVLLRAEERRATAVVIGVAPVHDADCAVTEKIGGTWYHVSDIPSGFRSRLVADLLRTATLPEGQFPCEGLLCLQLKKRQLKWKVQMETPDGECILSRFAEMAT